MSTTGAPRRIDYLPLPDISRALQNPKDHAADVIAASMARYGVVEMPALDERTGRLVAGHGRLDEWQRAHAAGEDPPDGITIGDDGVWLVPVTRGWSSRDDTDAAGYLLASNQSSTAGGWDDNTLGAILADLSDRDGTILDTIGFDAADLARLLGTDGDDGDDGADDDSDDDGEDERDVCPFCHGSGKRTREDA